MNTPVPRAHLFIIPRDLARIALPASMVILSEARDLQLFFEGARLQPRRTVITAVTGFSR